LQKAGDLNARTSSKLQSVTTEMAVFQFRVHKKLNNEISLTRSTKIQFSLIYKHNFKGFSTELAESLFSVT
jgi:hypothetical protein